jgi:hypothetical protein
MSEPGLDRIRRIFDEVVGSNLQACLTPEQRTRYLAETESEASEAAASCEAPHAMIPTTGRAPPCPGPS